MSGLTATCQRQGIEHIGNHVMDAQAQMSEDMKQPGAQAGNPCLTTSTSAVGCYRFDAQNIPKADLHMLAPI